MHGGAAALRHAHPFFGVSLFWPEQLKLFVSSSVSNCQRYLAHLLPAFQACVDGTLSDELIQWRDEHCVTIVMASGGYPGSYDKGKAITGLDEADVMEGVTVFHAGTRVDGDSVVTSGGRVLGVTARGGDLRAAVDRAYEAVGVIAFEGAQNRTDIAAKAL